MLNRLARVVKRAAVSSQLSPQPLIRHGEYAPSRSFSKQIAAANGSALNLQSKRVSEVEECKNPKKKWSFSQDGNAGTGKAADGRIRLPDDWVPPADAVERLNQIDPDRGQKAPGEAYFAAQLEAHVFGVGTLERAPSGTGADYVVSSGPFEGMHIDLKYTPRNAQEAEKINEHFERSFPKFSKSLKKKLADKKEEEQFIVAIQTGFLNDTNEQMLLAFIVELPPDCKERILIVNAKQLPDL